MAKWVELQEERHHGHWAGKLIVEMGAGCGLVGLLLAHMGARVTLTDLEEVRGGGWGGAWNPAAAGPWMRVAALTYLEE